MSLFEVGRICLKTAGRDARQPCVVVEIVDPQYVVIDGAVRRRKCNIAHLEPLAKMAKVAKGASTAAVIKALVDSGFSVSEKKKGTKERKKNPGRLKKQKVKHEKKVKVKKAAPVKEAKVVSEKKVETPKVVEKSEALKAEKEAPEIKKSEVKEEAVQKTLSSTVETKE